MSIMACFIFVYRRIPLYLVGSSAVFAIYFYLHHFAIRLRVDSMLFPMTPQLVLSRRRRGRSRIPSAPPVNIRFPCTIFSLLPSPLVEKRPLCSCLVCLAVFPVSTRPALSFKVGLGLSYALSITRTLTYGVRSSTALENQFNAVERVQEFIGLAQEEDFDEVL